ncbi:ribosome biogenesis GTPase Der [Sphaerochaeta sp. PS]|uniref:ribosome biogenesis GTPase Der n=1 Tax=Sphaerochaeta sp. PS TaxID=3076336 RepID=UPI0028A5439F|nr:ribosome biogenesis GTPase Der [Sphaerochaeta sp. PS]MDT4760954.1 ribosome biogenesis GTPase Der [Sphaerochaeta sp. PS]
MTDSIISPPSELDIEQSGAVEAKMPVIAIIGRPNVGKSTLFNRLIGKRRAITDPTPGVTRDPIPERWLLGNHPVTIIDSGGVKIDREGLDGLVAEKSLSLLATSDAIIFMMDITEVTAEDRELLEFMRPFTDKMVLVVNKVDTPSRDDLLWEYYEYGYQRVLGISAAHGHGIEELEDMLLGMLDMVSLDEAPEEKESVKLAILGKPNTGKSTLANLLVGEDISIVSNIAGTTRDVVMGAFTYKGSDFTVLDTAGIRRKNKVDDDVEYYSVNRAIKTIDEADVVLLMIDAIEGLSDQDKKIAQLIVRRGKGVILVLNKIDLLAGVGNQLDAIKDRMRFLFPILSFAPISAISATQGIDIGKLLDTVWGVWKQLNKRVDTSTLNTAIKEWGEAYQPPRGSTGHFKVYYGTQISANPIRFLVFVNKFKDFPPIYVQYMKNCIRRDLGFTQVPIEIDLRERKRNPSLNDRPKKFNTSETSPKGPVSRKLTGGRAVAKPKGTKPGNKASVTKSAKRTAKQTRNAGSKKRG